MGNNKKPLLRYLDTYVFIDVSNIRWACLKTLGFHLDFVKLAEYFKRKNPNLRDLRYYEGIAVGDEKKQKMFDFLSKKGYTICPLERKAYNSTEIEEHDVRCPKCNNTWTAAFSKEQIVLKSNVDVYLTAEMMALASQANHPIRIILVSCDGDYAEAIRAMLNLNSNTSVGVIATPFVHDMRKNTLSVRLKKLRSEFPPERYMLHDIKPLRPIVESSLNH